MKTEFAVKLCSASCALLLGTLVAGCAGTGPSSWNRTPATHTAGLSPATTQATCAGCQTMTNWATGDRGPAGKGLPGTSVQGKTHTCKACTGSIVTNRGTVKDTMAHHEACIALLCCK